MDFDQLAVFHLAAGAHADANDGLCAMEAVAWLEGLRHTDHPTCTCPVIAAYVRTLNDRLPDKERQRLIAYLPRLVGTVSPGHEWQRAQYLVSQVFGKVWPSVFRILKMEKQALEFEQIGKEWEGAVRATLAARVALADRAALAALDARVDLADLAVRAARAARADLADLADLASIAARVYRTDRAALVDLADRAALVDLADRAALAAFADHADLYQAYFYMLDGALAIGVPSSGFTQPIEPRILEYRKLVGIRQLELAD